VSGRLHELLLVVHRWVALVASVLILVVAVTGSALVFEGAMDRGLHPRLWRVTPAERRVSIDSMITSAKAAASGAVVTVITLPPLDDRAALVQAGPNQIFVNPFTGAVQARRSGTEWNATLPRRIHALHVSLMSGRAGGKIVGAITAIALFLVLSGVILWWRDKLWRVRWSASWKRVIFDLHHSLGVIAALVMLIIAASGVIMHYESLSKWIFSLDASPPPAAPTQPAGVAGAVSISSDSAYQVAMRTLPGARATFLVLPLKPDQPFVVAMRFPEDHTPGGRSRVFVDRFTGSALLATSTRQAQIGSRIGNALRSIHTGDLFGKPTEAIWLAAAIILASQALTGAMMWWNGRRGRAALARPRA
jgi:uncharacterized iron-regulated membrane protein